MPKESAATGSRERCALIFTSSLCDGLVIADVLADAGIESINYTSAAELLSEARGGAGIIIIAEEALVGVAPELLAEFFAEQPPWSEVPVVVLTAHVRSTPSWRQSVADLPFVQSAIFLERPLWMETLVHSAKVAMRSRDRQYQLRDHLVEREELLARTHTLFRELQHRVKNNLQVIQSLVRLSAKRAPADVVAYFDEVQRQISAIGQVHHKLYAGDNLDPIDLSNYISEILDQFITSFGSLNERVRVRKQLEPISVDGDAAIPIGLIVTELLTNAFKHAFPDTRHGEVCVGLASRSGYGELTIMDDGVGLAEERDGNGLRIVKAFVSQIEGDLELLSRAGTRWTLRFPLAMAQRLSA
ncbi:MAG TPA: histidine kinase dimerization/phosphoacceptor domain -containing protein [Methylocella sp.]|jgi:two-component sensor histidine kinase